MTERLPFHFLLSCIGEGNGNPLQCSYFQVVKVIYLSWILTKKQFGCGTGSVRETNIRAGFTCRFFLEFSALTPFSTYDLGLLGLQGQWPLT